MTPVIAIHGGAGATAHSVKSHRPFLTTALEAGYAVLQRGGASLDAVIAAVVVMEDSGLFNAGKGSVRNADGRHELDAAIMDGNTLSAGGVACVGRIRNPVLAARDVMEHSKHVLMVSDGAERFARKHGLSLVSAAYFSTRRKSGARGTVGAVALDRDGDLAAATSTGGFTGKLPGRVGDSPLVGAGVYADNAACAVSSTGSGEHIIRALMAYEVVARMRYLREPLARAAAAALRKLARLGGDGGLIAVDRRGRIAMPFNTSGMYRASIGRDGRPFVAV
jgi:isoaspartyl peptidase/L-asparaginase-like protein (Ntn-hydrolase superfamily)